MTKKISIVIPTYNRKDILKETLLSFKNQSFKDFEIIISDDGSIDGTGEMIESLNVPYPIKYIWNENTGRSAARNRGVEKTESEIVLFVDDHIIVDKKLIEEHLNYHNKFKDICAIKGRVEYIKDIIEIPKETQYIPNANVKHSEEQNPFRIFYTNNISIKKKALQKVGGFDEDFKEYGFQDQELGYRLKKSGYKFKINPNAIGYIFPVKTSFEDRCDKARQSGHSAVLFYRKHPFAGLTQLGVNPINTIIYFLLSLNNNWWLKNIKTKYEKAKTTGNEKLIEKYKSHIKHFYFLYGIHEKLFRRDQKEISNEI